MSTKFNRNDINAGDDKFYLDDYRADLNSVEQNILDALKQFEILPCIISGLTLTPAAYPSVNITVAAGSARDHDGKPITIATPQTVQMTDISGGNNYVILQHQYSTDTPRKASETGVEYDTRKYDDYELIVAETYADGDIVLGNVKREGNQNALYLNERTPDVAKPFACVPPPKPTRLTLTTGWDDDFRKNGAAAGLISTRPAFIKAEFGDKGTGTASENTFTWTTNRVGNWTANEWGGQYLSCADGNSWRVVSNTTTTLTLEEGAAPISGAFFLGPDAAGYRFIVRTLDPDTDEELARAEDEAHAAVSPVQMETIWHNLTADIKYSVQVASKGSWFQKDWSDFCAVQTITAGGLKEIPDNCADTIKNLVVSADDDGIRLAWDIEAGYADKVSGVEIVYTDDGTDPDFTNKSHRKIFTDRKATVLPARITTDTTTYTVKAKLRAVDRGGRHCVTPITITPIATKKYPADISALVTDYKNIITPGSFGTLKDFLAQSINIPDGRDKGITELESVMSDLQGDFESPAKRFEALAGAAVIWKYVRIVAKDGTGQFSTIQAAVDSIPETSEDTWWTILICPGRYQEEVNILTFTSKQFILNFIGLGNVIWEGGIRSDDTNGLVRINIVQGITFVKSASPTALYPCLSLDNSIMLQPKIRHCRFVTLSTNAGVYPVKILGGGGLVTMRDCELRSNSPSGCIQLSATGDNTNSLLAEKLYLYANHASANAIFIATQNNADRWLNIYDSSLRTASGTCSIDASSGFQSVVRVRMSHCRYVVAPNATNITVDYGTAQNQSNVVYDDGDFLMVWDE